MKSMINCCLTAATLLLTCACAAKVQEEVAEGQESNPIRINQLGFYPNAAKIAVIKGEVKSDVFYITTPNFQDTVHTASLGEERRSPYSSSITRIADFSRLDRTGTFVVTLPDVGNSYPFEIRQNVHQDVAKAAIKGFYFQRMSTALSEEYAGQWARDRGHPDTAVMVHASAATSKRPKGTVISAPLGWYDAGDYNKYIVNSGITMGTLLALYEDFPDYFNELTLSIPENTNELPDLLDEILWNLRWMLAMQDPNDGGVYHKLTTEKFEGAVMPADAKAPRYVIQKSTAATLDFAAVMAQAARIYRQFDQQVPGLADSCLIAAENAWDWANQNSNKVYNQTTMNKEYEPDIKTGAYGDRELKDEFAWAVAELWITTGNNQFMNQVNVLAEDGMELPSWSQVRSLGFYTLLRHRQKLDEVFPGKLAELEDRMIDFSDSLLQEMPKNAYAVVMGGSKKDFVWGSNAVAANQGIALIQAFKLTGEEKYLSAALTNLDYLLGRNATGYSYLTGYGTKTPQFPHHRPSEADGVEAPVPGLLVGGPNPGQQDDCSYPSDAADESYVDDYCSYASNEIAINWNAPFAYLAAALEALQADLSINEKSGINPAPQDQE